MFRGGRGAFGARATCAPSRARILRLTTVAWSPYPPPPGTTLGRHSQLRCVAHSTYTTHDQSITSPRSRSSSILASFAAVLNPAYPRSLNHLLSAGKAPVKKHSSVAILMSYATARILLASDADAKEGTWPAAPARGLKLSSGLRSAKQPEVHSRARLTEEALRSRWGGLGVRCSCSAPGTACRQPDGKFAASGERRIIAQETPEASPCRDVLREVRWRR